MIRLVAIILTLVAASRAATFSKRAVGGCETQADVTFVLDSSDIVGKDNFDKELDFIANTVSQMDTSPGKTRVSVVTYSSGVYNQFFLKENPTRTEIMNIPFRGGRTHTADAIRYVTQTSFNPVHGARNNVPHIAVLVSNSPSSSKQITKIEAQSAKDNNIIMYSVGVGSGVDTDELQSIASDPDSRYYLHTQNYGALGSVAGPLATKLCNELPSTSATLPAPTSCLHKADLAFLIDSSTSVGPGNFQKMENFLKQSISKLDLGPDKVHVGLMQYSSYPNMEFPLNMYTDRIDALKAVENIHYMSGGTNTADALKYMREHMFALNSGARGNVPRIAIVVTDGGSINGASTTYQADQAKQTNNIGLVAVGVGNNINKNELDSIATSPASQNVITVSSYDQLDQIVDQVLARTCTISPTLPPMVTAGPGGTLPPDTCVDKVNCASYGQSVCSNYGPWANDNCARYCGVCTPLQTTPAPACQDSLATCATYGLSACTQFPEWAKANCQQFCGLCSGITSSTGFYGKCSYKGQTYQTGAKWSDACDYDCICEDGNTGRYKCFNKCPLYHGMPKDCTLIKKDGECCLQPVCNFHQTIQKFESTGKGQTASGIKVCVSNGKQYFEGQTWEDGCSKQCVCANATEGLYTCDAICPSYNSIPSNCHLDKKPGDCCQKPICEYDQQHGSFTGIGTVSGQGIGANPTTPLPCVDRINTCAQYGQDVCTNFQGWSSDNCRKFCGVCGGEPTPNSDDKCVYQGQSYGQGKSWSIGCDTQCTCENALYGYYRCDNTCPKYNNLPAGCYETKHNTDCCTTVRCDSGNFIGSTTDPNSIGSGGLIHVLNPTGSQQVVSPTQPSGATVAPGAGGTGFVAPTLNGCLFKGQLYVQDQTWEDGCSYSCQCTDSSKGVYSCRPKCPMYKNLPSSCPMETDHNDPCCQAPKCRYDPITGSTYIPIPAFQPAVLYHGLVRPPTVGELYNQNEYTGSVLIFGTNLTPAPPTQRANTTGGIGHCVYRGTLYSQGQTWEDGCDYNCVCEDSRSGLYRCIEKCNHFGNLPQPYCYLKQDPANPCCKIPYCNFPINYVTNTGYISTAKPPSDHCEYKGSQYQQGQSWFDGCDRRCTCDDALSGTYRCLTRCPSYQNTNSNCTMVPDPNDPYCCTIPSCPAQNTTGGTSQIPTPAPSGYYTGYQGANIGKCVYKGDSYVQGETWSDGCDFDCECVEAGKGHYTCTDKCPKYPSLPSQCRLISDFTKPCCKRPVCDGQPGSAVTGLNPVIGGTTAAPNPIPTLAPNAQYCVYENAQYVQGQTWEVGCEYRCRCDDASRGVYICNERCPKYDHLGSECSLVSDVNDACCLAPRCIIPPLTGNATGGLTPDMIPTAAPGVISGSINIPTPAPLPGGSTVAPPILTWCEYKGARYGQNEKWYDGCDYQCECVSASTGKFKCVERCRRYLNLPAQCRLVKDPANPCCKTPECDFQGVTQGITNMPTPPVGPTLGPPGPGGPTFAPNPNFTPTPAPTIDACVYKGKNYNQGQQWYDGCDYVCYCENGPAGVYRCSERCAAFPKLPASCQLVADPKDPFCCRVPECSFTPANGTYTGFGYPTAAPGVITGGSVVKPTPRPNSVPTAQPIPGVSTLAPTAAPTLAPGMTPAPTFKDVCVYKGQQYTQGQKWEDGCDYNCECVDAKAGFYQCSERCPRFVNLPDGCTLQRDYVNPCCMKPYCVLKPTPKPAVTPSLGPGQTPSIQPNASPNPVCMYNGVPFTQGQSWSDGCELKCVCENATTGYFRCNDRCPHYDLTPGCTMITDPRDSCCVRPYCDPRITPTPAPAIPTAPGVPGQVYTPLPGQTYAPGLYPTLPGGVPLMPGMMLTPAPGQTYAPGLYPTLPGGATLVPPMAQTPYPGYTYPAPIPTAPGIPGQLYTPAPGQTFAPNLYPTIPGGQPLKPGMILTPLPGQTYAPGLYPTLPGGATLVPPLANTPRPAGYTNAPIPTAPGIPGQTYTPSPGKTYAPYLYPTIPGGETLMPGMMLTPKPGQVYIPGFYPTLPGGATLVPPLAYTPPSVYTPAPKIPTAPGIIGQTYTPSPGHTYAPGLYPTVPGGQTLVPGMMLTPQPGQTYAPGLYPTLPGGATLIPPLMYTPYPGFTYAPPIPIAPGVPGQLYTPAPGKTYAPNLYPTIPGGQPLKPGMMLTPAPGQTYAPSLYPTLPGGATLVPPFAGYTFAPIPTAPGVPGQIYTPSPGKTYAPGLYPTVPGGQTLVPGMMLTPQPGQTYAPGLYPTLPGGQTLIPPLMYTPYPGFTYAPPIPTAPGVPGQLYTPAPGKTYAPNLYPTIPGGQPLVPGMILTPLPGQTYAPSLYPTLPGGATLVPPFAGYTFAPIPTAPGVPGQIYTPSPGHTYAPGLYPTVPGGQTLVPGMMLTPQPGKTYAPGLFPTLPGGATLVPPMINTPYPGYTYPAPVPTAPGVPGQLYTAAPRQTFVPAGLYPTLPGGVPPLVYTPAPKIPTAPGIIGQTYTPSPGHTYSLGLYPTVPGGQTLVPGMMLTPRPGQTYAPGLYPTLPGGQTLIPPLMYTPFPGYTYAPPIPTAPGVPGQQYTPAPGQTFAPNLYPTIPGGQPLKPGMMLTPAPGQTYSPFLYPTLPGGATLVPPFAGYTFAPIPTAPGVPGQLYTPSPGHTYAPGLYPTAPGGQALVPGMMLTPQPGKTYAPGLFPTLPGGATLVPPMINTPYPGFTYPAPIPTAPGIPGQTYTPAPGQTFAPNLYPTIPGGQPLVPGMILTPLPGQTYAPGLYPTLPGGATLVPPLANTPRPGYTFAPVPTAPGIPGQTYTPSPGKTFAPNLYPTVPGGETLMPGMMLTPKPGEVYIPGLYPTLPGGATLVPPMIYTPYPGYTNKPPIPTAPGIPGQTYTPSPGKTYAPGLYPTVAGGQTLVPGMMLTPQPGQTYAPGLYPTLPGGQTLIPPRIYTPYPGFTYAPPIPTAPGVPGQLYTPAPGKTYAPNLYPTIPGGQPLMPGMILTPLPGLTYAPNVYPTLPGGATLVPPFAGYTFAPIPTAPGVPGQIYTPSPGKTYAPGLYPTVPGGQTLVPGMMLTPQPGKTYAPGLFPTLPGGATLVPPFAYTPYPGYTFSPPIPTAPGVPGQLYTPSPGHTYAPGLYPTVPGGQTLVPGMMLTPRPGQTYAPGLYPTLPGGATLIPPFKTTPIPTAPGVPGQTYTPSPGQTYAPGLYPTLPGGVTLVPGMMLTPQPGKTYAPGLLPTLPGGVTLVPPMAYTPYPGFTFAPPIPTAPGIPGQIYTPSPGHTYAPGLYPTVPGGQTLVPGMMLTPQPGQTYAPGLYPTLPGGATLVPPYAPTPYPGFTSVPIPTAPGIPGQTYTPSPGRTYAPYLYPTVPGGETLMPGMMLTPEPGVLYQPGLYPTLPGGATLVPPLASTPYPKYTYAPRIPTAPGIIGQTYTPSPGHTFAPGLYPTVPGGQTLVPGMMLTPRPGQTYAPGLYPTLPGGQTLIPPLMYTPFPGYTYAPPIPTAPGVPGQPYTPAPGKTFAPNLYPTIPGGQPLVPGMILTPLPGQTYPPSFYPTLPGGATLVPPFAGYTFAPIPTAPGVPGQIYTPSPGHTYAPYLYPTAPGGIPLVPGMMLTPQPGKTYAPGLYPTLPGGATLVPPMINTPYPGYAPIPTAPGVPGQLYTPAPGKTFSPSLYPTLPGGQPLVPGMMLTPRPGQTYAPGLYPTLPGGATLVPPLAYTAYPGFTSVPIPTAPGIPGQTYTPSPGKTYAPYLYPTIPGGETLMPGMMLTPQPGVMYQPGAYPTLPGGFTLVPPMVPKIPPTPAVTPSPYPVPTAVPGIFEGKGVNGQGKVCRYEGVSYHEGEKWQDGCYYNCECIDESIGRYRCKERCPLFLNIPSYCRLVVDPSDACCKVPQCVEPTLRPTPAPQPIPGVSPTPYTGPQTPAPTPKESCVFNGKSYTQGQQWYDGCDKTCVCEDAQVGYYRCDDRCPKFPNLPNTCTLTADPKDPQCCKVPQCIPIPGVNGNTVNPSAQPIIVTGVPGVITGVGATPVPHPYVTPILPPGQTPPTTNAPMPKNECIYKGQAYHQGQKWQDGCDYKCECIDGKMGRYQCTQRCSTFPVIPSQCQLQRDTSDYCCFVPLCDFNQTVPTPGLQVSPVPGASNIPPTAFCVYNGLLFKQGQVWEEGCSKQCRCDNAVTNYYSCFDRCPSFSNLDASCVMKTNPNDPCCQIPECLNSPTPAPNMQPTLVPGATPYPNPYPVPTLPPGKITGSGPQVNPNTGLPQTIGFCEYKGVQYHKGDTWDDGCNYKCQCIEETTGTFTCNERCPRFAKLPANCFMATDPKDTCCKVPSCPPTAAPGLTPTPAPGNNPNPTLSPFASPTPVPQSKEVCIYQGHPYTQGQKWFDGCDKKCMCENAKIGYYTCTDRCPSYTNLTPSCIMVPDPNDPDCCTAPQCDNTNTTNPTGVYGSIVGNGRPPTPKPFLAPTLAPGASPDPNAPSPTPMPKVCVYKGTQYAQGQKWQDGCSYKCECMNADAGRFICTDRCARYPNLPLTCRLEFDPMDPCCEKPNCTPNAAPTLRPGQTTPNPNDFCVYNGIPYQQGQTWKVGCEKVCRCDDAKIGRVNCDDRCPSFPVLTGTCSLVTDPSDDCCQVPECVNTNTTNPNQVIIGVPGTVTNGGHGTLPNPNSATRNGCVYKGQYYTQGQQWDDGCTYHCSCDDGVTGLYRCTEKCPRYARIPSYCTMVQDPVNQCCEKPYCTPIKTPGPQPSLAPGQSPSVSPLTPPQLANTGCNYNGQIFQQGQLWYDGCSKICMCENGRTNFYRCQDRCAKFSTIGAGCTMVPDSRDPACCKVPSCPLVTPSVPPTPGIYTPVPSPPGVVDGYGKVPTPAPQSTPVPQVGVSTIAPVTPVPGCLYKGQVYGKGVKWDDGCDYQCECLDSMTGRYQCSQRCQRYNNIPKDKCVLVEDPNDKCCQVPYCDFLHPTPFPNGVPTPRPIMAPSSIPGVSPTPRPNVQPTMGPHGATPANPFLAPILYPTKSPSITPAPNGTNPGLIPQQQGFCEYKGVYYTQGQTWTDGCQQICRCEAPGTGYFQCTSRCPRYNNLNSSCVLKTNPADACCLAPDCNQYPTPAPNPVGPTTPIPIYVPSAVTGSFIGSGQNPNGITGGGINFCVYKGKVYNQGMTWDDGCNYKCTCEDASRGLYRCNDRCPQYYQLPWQCHYEKDPKDTCCQTAKCDFNLAPTPAPSTPAPITVAPTPHGWTGPTIKPLDVCMYIDNTTYTKGQTWDVGCDFRCVCEDPSQNKFNCNARCQVFASLPSVCTLIPDPSDKCCEVPSCGAYQPVTVINGTATPPPNSLNVLPVGTHGVFAGSSWGPGSGTHPVTGKRDKCIYKGQAYSQGQSWNDGCQFVCSCEDAEKGVYRCLSKCPAYPQIPSYCHKVTVPGQCCPSLSCDVPGYGNYNPAPQLIPVKPPTPQPGVSPTPRPSGLPPVIHVIPSTSLGNTTGHFPGGGYPITTNQISGITSQCIYKNKLYNQGESWDDDCDYACKCIDGRTGYYECKPKCPAYPDLPATCFLIKASGNCCRTPQCTYYGMVLNPVAHPDIGIPVVGQYSGGFTGFKPGINFTQTFPSYANSGTRDVCVYKGVTHQQNDKWDDGCDFSCICDDASTGHYQCNTKCPTFAKLPSYCSMITQPGDCCKKVQCDPGLLLITTTPLVTLTPTPNPPTPTPDPNSHCRDTINNCGTYGKTACSQYSSWAKRNCQAYCDLCPPPGVSTTTPCMDQLPNCHEFGHSQCSGIYTVWAKDNCADYCGLCPGATHWPTTTATTTTSVPCLDVLPNCQDFVAANFCNDPAYGNWSLTNCAKTCGLCNGGAQGPTSTVGSVTSGNGWLLLMKGVAGVPGNLYQLWSGTGTLNPNVPEAMYLTAQYPGHFKPDLSNHWGSLCLDKVKVSIYSKGVEKAWIIFNATGADKMNWYTKDRIIDSSWSDIKTAASQLSMAGDPTVGRQFYASGNSNGCDSTGWMMISTTTSNPCFFESGNKPAFYYAPGQTQARWGFTKGTGDVFAIQAHSTCPTTLVVPTNSVTSNGCSYKGQVYKAGDNWVDDCKYNCTCDSDTTGHYTCNDLCPIYTNLPSSLKLEKVPGQCCPKVVFVFTGTFETFTNPPNMCYYKGNSYGTGETWDDGCDYKCNCLDAATGRYKCTQKCVTWNLPPICHLNEPAPGKCCKTPNCPHYVVVNYPPNYKEE